LADEPQLAEKEVHAIPEGALVAFTAGVAGSITAVPAVEEALVPHTLLDLTLK
jgi:hypothetical protein